MLSDLRVTLGRRYRIRIDAEPDRRRRPVIVSVRWTCGCAAEGGRLSALALRACPAHAPAVHGVRARAAVIPLFRSLISRG